MSAKLPSPCKHSGTSWSLESAESLPAGDLEEGQIKGMHNEKGVGDRGCIYTEGVCRGQYGAGQRGLWKWKTMKERGGGFNVHKHTPHPQGPRLLCSFIFFLLKTDFFVPVSVPRSISQTNDTQPFETFAAGRSRRLSVIRQHGHLILCDPNLGTLTRKPKPRADKQAPSHALPQTTPGKRGGRRQLTAPGSHPSFQP